MSNEPTKAPGAASGEDFERFRGWVYDQLAEINGGHAVMDAPGGKLAVVDLNRSLVWLVTVEPARFEVAS